MTEKKQGVEELAFPTLFKQYRRRIGVTQKELAGMVRVTAASTNSYEKGKKVPRLATLNRIADAFELHGETREKFLASARRAAIHNPEDNMLCDELIGIFADLKIPPESKKRLVFNIHEALEVWKQAQHKRVRSAVIPVAGWQDRLLAPESTAKMVGRALTEIKNCGIERGVVVITEGQEKILPPYLQNIRREIHVRFVVQHNQSGLGHAIRIAEGALPTNEPFAVILPDDNVEVSCLTSMIGLYNSYQCCVVALTDIGDENKDGYKGIANCAEIKDNVCKLAYLHETPSKVTITKQALSIIGRYILTSDVFKILEKTQYNARSGGIELTDALDKLAQSQAVYGHIYKGQRRCIGPDRAFWERKLAEFFDVDC